MERSNAVLAVSALSLLISISALWVAFALSHSGDWECSQFVCSKVMTQDEWVKDFCFMNSTLGEMQCNVRINDIPFVVPLSMLDLNEMNQCSEVTCVEEMWVRAANFTLENE